MFNLIKKTAKLTSKVAVAFSPALKESSYFSMPLTELTVAGRLGVTGVGFSFFSYQKLEKATVGYF